MANVAAILDTLDAVSTALTLCEVGADIELTGPAVDGMAALLVTSGTLHVRSGDHRLIVPVGHVALIPAPDALTISSKNSPARITLDSRACLQKRGRWLVAVATAGRRRQLTAAMVRIVGGRAAGLAAPSVLPVTASDDGEILFALLRAQLNSDAPGAPALALSLVSACIIKACHTHGDTEPDQGLPRETGNISLGRALAAVRARPGDDHRAESLAGLAGMSRSTFIRQLDRFARMSPREYVQHIRLEEAALTLRTTARPVKAIAADLGFQSRSHFSRAFKQQFGLDPTRYRHQGDDRDA